MLGKYNRRTVRASSGAVAPGAIVSFFWQSNGTPAMVYADQDGNNPLGSSVQSDADGRIAVFVTPGLYRIVTTLDGDMIDEITHEPIVGQLSYADPNSYALRSELKLHDEDIQLVAKSLVEIKLAGGPRLASGRVLAADEIGMLADTGATLKTSEYHDGTSVGGAEYQLRTRASYRTEIGDAAWVPDGYGDHYLFGATTYVAVLKHEGMVNLYTMGGIVEGNCIAAMDAALTRDDINTVKVPDGVTLGRHVFDSPFKKIVGGVGVTFDVGIDAAGIYPGQCGYIEIRDFKDFVLRTHPLSGGVVVNGHQFVGAAPGADIHTFIVTNNSGTGGRSAVTANFENGRFLRHYCEVSYNHFKKQNGSEGGEGYGIQAANVNNFGDINIAFNTIEESGRHSIYLARNPGGGKMSVIGNVLINHRENSPTKGQLRSAFVIFRCSNVHAYGNTIDGFYDGALGITEERESVANPLDAADIYIYSTVIRNPKNTASGVYIGILTPTGTGRIRNVLIDGLSYKTDGLNNGLTTYHYGNDITFRNVYAEYHNISTGSIRPMQIQPDGTDASKNLKIQNMTLITKGCVGAVVEVYRPIGSACTSNFPFTVDGTTITSDASTVKSWGPQTTITNTEIKVYGTDLVGFVSSVRPKAVMSPSVAWDGIINTSGIATPVGSVTPNFIGQDFILTTAGTTWKAIGLTSADWVKTGG